MRAIPLASALCVAACEPAVMSPQGVIGEADKTILIDSVIIMLAIIIPTVVAILGFAWWFRASNARAVYRPNWAYSGRLELIVWAIPLHVIILLGGVAWIGSHELDPAVPLKSKVKALEVQGVSLDWKWLFIYPDQKVASVNQLVIPAGTPVHFSLTSASVMNAFFVPQLGSMIYTMNGMVSQLNLSADHPGMMRGLSSHYSGDGFSGMHFEVQAVPPAQFATWVQGVRGGGKSLDQASYADLAKQSQNVAPFTYGQADPALFNNIVSQMVPPGPGPDEGDVTVSPRSGH
jgi:cytochrome o ubiquinol oxidase subunit 2